MKQIERRFGWSALLLTLLLFIQAGCMSPARKLDEAAVKQSIHNGQTLAEVRQLFGQPKRSSTGTAGRVLDVFCVLLAPPGRSTAWDSMDVRSLHVLYGADNRVEKFTYYVGKTRVYSSAFDQQWQVGTPLEEGKVSQIQRNVTTRAELLRMFGAATAEGLDAYGDNTMSWTFIRGRDNGSKSSRELIVRLDDNSVAVDYLFQRVNL